MILDLALLAGLEASRNLGEGNSAGLFQAQARHAYGEMRAFANTSDKVESGKGYILGADVDFRQETGVVVGLGYRYRDGGSWVKHTGWIRGGFAVGFVTLIAALDLTSANQVKVLEACGRWLIKKLAMETRIGLVRYNHGETGNYMSFSFGHVF